MSYTIRHVSLRGTITSVWIVLYVFSRYNVSISIRHVPLSGVPCHIQSDTLHPSSSDAFSQKIRHTIQCSCEEHILCCHVLLSIRHVTSIFLRCLSTEDTALTLQCRALVVTHCNTLQHTATHCNTLHIFPLSQKIRLLCYNVALLWYTRKECVLLSRTHSFFSQKMRLLRYNVRLLWYTRFFVTFFCLSYTFTSIFFRCCCTEHTVCACVLQYSALVENTFFFVTFFCQSDTLHPSSSDAFPQQN